MSSRACAIKTILSTVYTNVRTHTNLHTCIHTLVHTHTMYIHQHPHPHACTSLHTYTHTYIHACMYTPVHIRTHTHMHVHTCLYADAPEYTASAAPTTVLEGRDFTSSFQLTANPPPAPDSFMWTKNNQTISDSRVAVSVSSIAITATKRDDSGVYQVTSANAAGVGTASFTLNVQCECNWLWHLSGRSDAVTNYI